MAILSNEDRRRMGTPHPDLLKAIEAEPFPDLTGGKADPSLTEDIRKNRAAHLARLRHLYPIPGPIPEQVKETEHYVEARDGYQILVRIYTPAEKPQNASPLLVMFHEGGWCMGDLTDEDLNCRMFVRDLHGVAVNVEYRLAPEHKFPVGVNDCWDVVRWCARSAQPSSIVLPADPKLGFIVGGASAGGNLAAVMCQIGRDEGLTPPLTGQYLCVPALLTSEAVPSKWSADYCSRTESISDPVLKLNTSSPKSTQILQPDLQSPLYSPLLHHNFSRLPPAYLQLAGLDPLRDEGLLYDSLLRQTGVKTKLDVYDGFGHMFWTNWPRMQRSIEFVDDTLKGFKWLLDVADET